jgi:hypothetical protein
MASWISGFFKSEKYKQLRSIVDNNEKINTELKELSNEMPNTMAIERSYQTLKSQLETVFETLKQKEEQEKQQQQQQSSQPSQTGGRRTKKSKHSKKSRKTRKTRK